MNTFKKLILRNRISSNGKIVPRKTVNMDYWTAAVNLGDTLAPVIFNYMLSLRGINPDKKVSKTKHLITLGSVISNANFDTVIWGSGVHTVNGCMMIMKKRYLRKFDIRAVRGPETQKVLKLCGYNCPEIFGDPAIIMPLIFNPTKCEKIYEVSVIYHMAQNINSDNNNYHYIDIKTDNYESFIQQICQSKLVVSSSLHGIILAETYGVPAVFLHADMYKGIMKYFDWYYSTNRFEVRSINSLNELKNFVPMELPMLDDMRNQLMASFPYDLWEK